MDLHLKLRDAEGFLKSVNRCIQFHENALRSFAQYIQLRKHPSHEPGRIIPASLVIRG
ncbi:hypothetical protein D3C80_938250 [compost metagenome]